MLQDKYLRIKQQRSTISLSITKVLSRQRWSLKYDRMLYILINSEYMLLDDKLTPEKAHMDVPNRGSNIHRCVQAKKKRKCAAHAIAQGAKLGEEEFNEEYKHPYQNQQSQKRTCGESGQQHIRLREDGKGRTSQHIGGRCAGKKHCPKATPWNTFYTDHLLWMSMVDSCTETTSHSNQQ